jgi:hypothetical protein
MALLDGRSVLLHAVLLNRTELVYYCLAALRSVLDFNDMLTILLERQETTYSGLVDVLRPIY